MKYRDVRDARGDNDVVTPQPPWQVGRGIERSVYLGRLKPAACTLHQPQQVVQVDECRQNRKTAVVAGNLISSPVKLAYALILIGKGLDQFSGRSSLTFD